MDSRDQNWQSRNCWDIEQKLNQMSDKTKEEKIEYLFQVIDEELSKSHERWDEALVRHCQRRIEELGKGDAFDLSAEELDRAWAEMKARIAPRPVARRRGRVWRRVVVAVAAVLLLATSMLTVIAHTGGATLGEYLVHLVKKCEPGDKVTTDGITFTYCGTSKNYDSIEELIAAENLDIMYPTKLPEELEIKRIKINEDSDEITFFFNTFDTNISIYTQKTLDPSRGDYTAQHVSDNVFYILSKATGEHIAVCHTEKYEYVITTKDYTNLKILMENMRGVDYD